MSGLEVTLN